MLYMMRLPPIFCLRSLNEGIKIPEELKVIAFDDVEYSKLFSIPLSSYVQPCREFALAAVNTMLLRVKNPNHPYMRLFIKGEVVVRQSTRTVSR